MTKLIGIGGFAGSGKDTLADEIIKQGIDRDIAVKKRAFAYPLKQQLFLLYGMDYEDLYTDRKSKEKSFTLDERVLKIILKQHFRWLIEEDSKFDVLTQLYIGVIKENFDVSTYNTSPFYRFKAKPRDLLQVHGTEFARECIHEDVWVFFLQRYLEQTDYDIVIVPDVRFDNEAQAVMNDGYLVAVDRTDQRITANRGHASEDITGVITLCDKAFTNHNGNFQAIRREAGDILESVAPSL